jgi:hypothetical protein
MRGQSGAKGSPASSWATTWRKARLVQPAAQLVQCRGCGREPYAPDATLSDNGSLDPPAARGEIEAHLVDYEVVAALLEVDERCPTGREEPQEEVPVDLLEQQAGSRPKQPAICPEQPAVGCLVEVAERRKPVQGGVEGPR